MIDVKIIKKAKQGHVPVGGGIASAGNSYTTGIQQTLADVLNFNAGLTRLLMPYDANNQPLTWAQATDPDGDGGIKAKTLRAAVTFASVGDIVAYQNGNLSGGTGGGGLDITALESYLTTNGYATQAWVSAHFNDYVLTKAAVEAVLTGNITSHTHDQYLTQHQSLANYMTRGEIGDTYQAKNAALSFTAATGYVAARFTNAALATSAAQNYIELWGTDGWFNLQAGHLLAHGAVTATQFIRTGGTASQFLKADGSVDSNSYLLSSAYTASDILTKIKTVDGAGSGLDADTLDGVHGKEYMYRNGYHCTDGCLVRLRPRHDRDSMLTVHIRGNSYYAQRPIDTRVQFYNYNSGGYIYNPAATHNGYDFGNINVFCYDGHVYLWFKQADVYQSFSVYAECTNDGGTGNLVEKITNAAMPTEGVTRLKTIVPKKSALITDNVASATKLQTARTLWGQSFDGTGDVSGTLSGVEDITFNANAKIAATANHIRLLTKSGGPQGLAAAQLLASDLYADWAKVPANGIYSKGNIATDGSLKIGGGTITWDAGNNAFMFSHTVASQGDMVAFQNGNLSGGTGGGGLDITALEDYLTTNGYATQDWVAAHFNDYVLTKAAVEAVLTGNITTHTHSQYLTEHQSLANYYTKTESDGKYLTAINKSMVEAVLTGNITTHTHSQYLTQHQSLANYMTRGEISDTYQTKNAALSFTAAEGYVAARFADNTLCAAAVDKYIEFWCNSGWYNFEIGSLTAHGAATATQFIRTGGTASQFLKADGSVDANTYLTTGAASDTYLPKATYTASDILTKIKTVDGAGSGLDADMLDGYQAFNFLRNRSIVSTADVHMNINEVPANSVQHDYKWDNAPTRYSGSIASVLDLTYNADWRTQLFVYHTAKTNILARSRHSGTTWGDWRALAFADSNVASATKLQTARTINGTAFDGTAAITTAKWGTARNLTIGNTAKSVDGSAPVAWSLAEIGALGVNANAVSASKLQTAHTLWGQSFDGTDNVAGTLSGVEDITFNANAKIAATDNHLRLLTKSGGTQGLAAAQLLASDLCADWAKVPANGIYSKGDISTGGAIKIGGGTITWDAGNNAFMFSHTVASQGDMVALQNGNLSGGTGGGGLDITALESYLTTNGYATQDWVSAHFNDYVLTKAAVEAVLTGNITTHTHNQYLTEHQSLANYYTKTEADGKYLTAITKSMVEAVLTGNITTHTHSQYLTAHQSLANYMTRGEISDTYQTKNVALSFTAKTGYVAARFTDAALATSAAQNYIELWGPDGWFNLQAGHLLAHGAVTATQFIRTGGTATQFLKADGSVDSNSYLLSSAYTAADILTKIKTVDGADSGLDADTLDGVHLADILASNVASATKLQTVRTLWGQSFDGTDNVAGTLSGVEDIIFKANARLTAMDNALRFFTKNGGAQGIQAGNLLISDLFSDANKAPENGIYSKDGLVTDGSIKIGGGTITWDEATNSFIFSHTVASQGDVVAFKQ